MRRGLTRRRSSTASVRRCGLEDVRRQWLAAFWRCRPVTRTKPGCPPRCDTSMPPCSASAGGPAGDEQRVRRHDEIAGFLVEACQRIDHAGLGQHRFNVAGLYVLRAVAEALPDADAQTAWKSARDDPVCSVAASRAELKSEETDSTPSRRLGDPGSLSGSSAFMGLPHSTVMRGNSESRKNLDNTWEIRVGSVFFARNIFPGAPPRSSPVVFRVLWVHAGRCHHTK